MIQHLAVLLLICNFSHIVKEDFNQYLYLNVSCELKVVQLQRERIIIRKQLLTN